MALVKITFNESNVTADMDADFQHFNGSGNGILYGVKNNISVSASSSVITFRSGYLQVYGRRLLMEESTKVSVNLDRNAYGYVVIEINTSTQDAQLKTIEETSRYPSLIQNDLSKTSGIYQFPLAQYTKTTTTLTLNTEFKQQFIYSNLDYYALKENVSKISASYLKSVTIEGTNLKFIDQSNKEYNFNITLTNLPTTEEKQLLTAEVSGKDNLLPQTTIVDYQGNVSYNYENGNTSITFTNPASGASHYAILNFYLEPGVYYISGKSDILAQLRVLFRGTSDGTWNDYYRGYFKSFNSGSYVTLTVTARGQIGFVAFNTGTNTSVTYYDLTISKSPYHGRILHEVDLPDYSVHETKLATKWINGKPIYRAVFFKAGQASSDSPQLISGSALGIGTLVNMYGSAYIGSVGTTFPMNYNDGTTKVLPSIGSNGYLYCVTKGAGTFTYLYIVVEYTK